MPTPSPDSRVNVDTRAPRRWPWARLLQRVFGFDVLVCDRCGGPAAAPRRGDRTPCGAAAPRRAGAGARAAAGAARPRRLTRARSRPPPAPPSPSVRGPGGAGSGPHLTDLRRLAGPGPFAVRYTPPTVMTRRPAVMTRRLGGHQAMWPGQERAFSLPFMKWLTLSSASCSSSSSRSPRAYRWDRRLGSREVRQPFIRALTGERGSPAHEGSRGVGAPST